MTEMALVTGGARNIGLAIARRLRSDGYGIVILDIEEPEDPTVGDFLRVDLADPEATGVSSRAALPPAGRSRGSSTMWGSCAPPSSRRRRSPSSTR